MDRTSNDATGRPLEDNDCNSNDSTSSSDDKTYHFRKGTDLDGFESFGALFADGLFTDLAICCAGKVFRCHRVVMAASSAYIKNALSAFNGSENNNCNTIMILPQEIKVADMEAILQFIYNGQVEVTRDSIESFLSSAKILHIKGLANIKLVYNNNHKNQNNQSHNHNHKNKSPNNTSSNAKSFNNENQNSENFNHNNCNNNNENNSNINANLNSPNKRKNGLIGATTHRSPNTKPDLNPNDKLAENAHNQSFHSSPPQQRASEPESKLTPPTTTSSSARRKQKTPKALTTNGLITNNTTVATNGIMEEEMEEEELPQKESTEELENGENDLKMDLTAIKAEEKSPEKCLLKSNGTSTPAVVGPPSLPCMIQIDADPTTFPSFCAAENLAKSAKRRRSSSLRIEGKNQKMLAKGNGETLAAKTSLSRTSGRKLGFIQFHKKTNMWNSGNNNKWKCEICNKLYGNKQTLKEHMDYFHSNRAEQIFTCTICQKEYTWKKSLMKHYRDIHQMNNTSLTQLSTALNNSNPQPKSTSTPRESADETSTEAPPQQWVTQSEDNSSQSK